MEVSAFVRVCYYRRFTRKCPRLLLMVKVPRFLQEQLEGGSAAFPKCVLVIYHYVISSTVLVYM